MRRMTRVFGVLSIGALIGGVGLTGPAVAGTGEGALDQRTLQLAEKIGHRDRPVDPTPGTAKLALKLKKLQLLSHGRVDVEAIGASNRGRPVWSATVGDGPRKVLYVTQQHGNETVTTPAALEFLRDVGVGDGDWQRALRDQVTIKVVVRANPDGAVRDWRYNDDPDADPEYGEKGKGYDINRYHNPEMAPENNPATEAGLVQREYAEFDPELVVDYHMQGRYADADGEEITASLMWPTHADVVDEALDYSKQAGAVAGQAMDAAGGNVSQYPGGDYEGIARNAYGLRGSGSVLIEYSDTGEELGPDFEQQQIRSGQVAMTAVAQSVGNGTVDVVDPSSAEDIPERGDEIESRTGRSAYPTTD